MKIVLDCNVLISAGITDGTCNKVILKAIKCHSIFISQGIVDEYLDTTSRVGFKLFKKKLSEITQRLLSIATWIDPVACPFNLIDKKDEIYIATALTAKADLLITGNKKHFPLEKYGTVKILSPREFLDQS